MRAWLTPLRLEAICVAITFITMMAGLITSNMDVDPAVPALFYLIAYISGGIFGVQAGIESLRHFRIDVDLLMILAALGAVIVGSPFEGAMLLFLFSLSNVLQAYALGRTRSAIQALMKLRPDQALVKRDGEIMLMPIEQLAVGDHILVRPGERVPLDGMVVEGESTLDQSSLTGESMPVSKRVGDMVFAGTVNQSGSLEVKVTKLARDSTIARLIKMVEEAQSQKAPTERFLDKFEQVYAVGVILFTLLLMIVPPAFLNAPFEESLYRAITVMVVASPCALIISTPASILSAIANGARRGILFKGGAHLERAGQLDIIAFDKTGTLTVGKPTVTDVTIIPMNTPDCDDPSHESTGDPCLPDIPEHIRTEQENILLTLAAAVESKSEHPLALAIVDTAKHRGLNIPEATDFVNTTGKGVRARIAFMGGLTIAIGNPRYFDNYQTTGMERAMLEVVRLQDEGKTSVLVAKINDSARANILGVIAIADVVRPSAPGVIKRLRELGIKRTVMLTGDNARVARAVARQTGVDEVYADLLPADKVAQIKRLREGDGKPNDVAMVGDGVNDAPALASASLGMAMGAAGTDVALETADVVLMSDDLRNIPYAISLSRQARRVVIQNLTFAIAVIIVLVIAALGFELPLPVGVVGHEGSTVIVVLNGLRLLMFREKQ
ncbi:MAG: heavy metal translocating P-type ATPase [Candidatus Brachytrichaceae bacterium NZ_4S206]|jgi:Cd2+/Zn2+-exporting ATPase